MGIKSNTFCLYERKKYIKVFYNNNFDKVCVVPCCLFGHVHGWESQKMGSGGFVLVLTQEGDKYLGWMFCTSVYPHQSKGLLHSGLMKPVLITVSVSLGKAWVRSAGEVRAQDHFLLYFCHWQRSKEALKLIQYIQMCCEWGHSSLQSVIMAEEQHYDQWIRRSVVRSQPLQPICPSVLGGKMNSRLSLKCQVASATSV